MNIIIKGTNLELTEAIKNYVEEKIGELEKFIDSPLAEIQARVEVGKISNHHKKGKVYFAEANINIGGKMVRSRQESEDLYAAIDLVQDEAQRSLKRFKGASVSKERRGARMIKRMKNFSPLAWGKRWFGGGRDKEI